jgi:hypothetical protein
VRHVESSGVPERRSSRIGVSGLLSFWEITMPLKGVKYRVTETPKGPVRLAFRGNTVVEAKNLKTGATHSPKEFAADRKKSSKKS